MKKCSGSVDSIETMGLVDGPGIRTVVFLTGCKLRCLYCHNPEMWTKGKDNYTPEELVKKIIRNKERLIHILYGIFFKDIVCLIDLTRK